MRKLAAAILALPILLPMYAPIVIRRSIALRAALMLGVGGVLGLGAMGIVTPRETVAVPVSSPAPVASTAFGPVVRAGVASNVGVDVTFSRPMDHASVAAAVTVSPTAAISLSWDAASQSLTIRPSGGWAPATLYSITIGTAATDTAGRALDTPTRAAFVTRAATRATIVPTAQIGSGVAARTAFAISFDHPVDFALASTAFHIEPAVRGTTTPTGSDAHLGFTFTPAAPLAPDVAYRVSLVGPIADLDGTAIEMPDTLSVTPLHAPGVIRFRPRNGTTDADRATLLSVRFTERMNRKTTAAAWSATANGKKLTGKIEWAEGDTVLVFTPSAALPAGAKVVMTVGLGATSAAGLPLDRAIVAHASVVKPARAGGGTTVPIPHASGGTVGSGSWYAVELYYLKLMNCTRTGGWVTSSGACSSPGGLSTPPIILDAGISNKVTRPYAKLLAISRACDHFLNGTPTDRLHRAGYSGWAAENIGCLNVPNPYASMIGTQTFFQNEKPCGGYCHYANLMNPAYKKCGIGVWISHGQTRVVIDFYHP